MSGRLGKLALRWYNYLVFAFLLAPLVVIVLSSLTRTDYIVFPPKGITLRWYLEIFKHEEFLQSFALSAFVATLASLVSVALGTPVAIATARHRFPGREFFNTLFLSPLMLPSVVLGVALLQYYSRLGIASSPYSLVLGHLILTVPYVVRLVSASLAGMDPSVERAAAGLGASPWQVFWRVTLPIIKSGVIAGGAFAFVISFDDLTVALFIVSTDMVTLPVRIFTYMQYQYDPLITSVSTAMIGLAAVAMFVIERVLGLGKLFQTEGGGLGHGA